MECRKCRGLMVEEWCADELEDAFIWKCLNCGAMEDAMILRNQGFPFPVRYQAIGSRISLDRPLWGVGPTKSS